MSTVRLQRKLRAARLGKGFTLREVAARSKGQLSHSFVSDTEHGVIEEPSPAKLRILGEILDLNYMGLLLAASYVTPKDLKTVIGS